MKKKNIFRLFCILIIILFSVVFYKLCKIFTRARDNFTNKTEKKEKALFILYGESFRESRQLERNRDTELSYKLQYEATNRHIKFCDMLKVEHEIETDIVINTYETKFEKDLREWYSDYNTTFIFKKFTDTKNTEETINIILHNNITESILSKENLNDYKFIILTRMDIYLKQPFYELFDINWKKIMFISKHPAICKYYGFNEEGDPLVNQTIMFIPNKYINTVKNDLYLYKHELWTILKKNTKITNDDMDFMSNKPFDADSYKDKNDYYYMVGRPENTVQYGIEDIDRTLIGKTKKEIDKIITPQEREKCDNFKYEWEKDIHVMNNV